MHRRAVRASRLSGAAKSPSRGASGRLPPPPPRPLRAPPSWDMPKGTRSASRPQLCALAPRGGEAAAAPPAGRQLFERTGPCRHAAQSACCSLTKGLCSLWFTSTNCHVQGTHRQQGGSGAMRVEPCGEARPSMPHSAAARPSLELEVAGARLVGRVPELLQGAVGPLR